MRQTEVLTVDPHRPDPGRSRSRPDPPVRGAGRVSDGDGVRPRRAMPSIPTRSVPIFEVKGRPADNPLIVHVSDAAKGFALATNLPAVAFALAEAFWPGPLTLVVCRRAGLCRRRRRRGSTRRLERARSSCGAGPSGCRGVPVAAPSANRSGRPSPTRAEHVLADLDGRIDAVVDGGGTGVGVESTVIDLTVSPPLILRPGGVSREQIEGSSAQWPKGPRGQVVSGRALPASSTVIMPPGRGRSS